MWPAPTAATCSPIGAHRDHFVNLLQRIALNTIWQVAAHAVGLVTSVASIVLLTRYLGENGFGEYVTIVTFGLVLAALSDFGLPVFLTREWARSRREAARLLHNALGLRLTSSMAVFMLVLVVNSLLPYAPTVRFGISLFAAATIFISLSSTITSVFRASLRMGRVAVSDVLGRLLALGVVLWVVLTRQPMSHLIGGLVVAHVMQLASVLLLSAPLVSLQLRFDFGVWRGIMKSTLPFAAMSVLAVIYARLDTIILSLFYNPSLSSDVGIYGAAYRVLDALLVLPVAFLNSVFPSMVQSIDRPPVFAQIPQRAFYALSTLAFPIVLGGIFLAYPIMQAVAGSEFVYPQYLSMPVLGAFLLPPSPIALQILLVALFFMFFGFLNGLVLIAAGRQQALLRIFLGVVVMNILLSVALIPKFSFIGAALATTISEVVGFGWSTQVVEQVGVRYAWCKAARPLLAATAMVAVLSVMGNVGGGLVFQFLLGGAVYAGLLYLVGGLHPGLLPILLAKRSVDVQFDEERGR